MIFNYPIEVNYKSVEDFDPKNLTNYLQSIIKNIPFAGKKNKSELPLNLFG